MKINISMELPVKAIPIDNYYNLEQKEYDVANILMGQSSTKIELLGVQGKSSFNSVHFKYELHGQPIDIYRSGAFSPYFRDRLPLIYYKEEVK